mmetsp:Transcript_56419/g.133952  ORF Transcript_56419/g.133952 Transcript_56419/m.133952 type:complete len:239 (+) Transcript_56419:3471-4187(+)
MLLQCRLLRVGRLLCYRVHAPILLGRRNTFIGVQHGRLPTLAAAAHANIRPARQAGSDPVEPGLADGVSGTARADRAGAGCCPRRAPGSPVRKHDRVRAARHCPVHRSGDSHCWRWRLPAAVSASKRLVYLASRVVSLRRFRWPVDAACLEHRTLHHRNHVRQSRDPAYRSTVGLFREPERGRPACRCGCKGDSNCVRQHPDWVQRGGGAGWRGQDYRRRRYIHQRPGPGARIMGRPL